METREEVKAVEVDYICPECNIGKLRPVGFAYASHPPKYPHKCNNKDCGHEERYLRKTYPYITHEKL